jgi:hypothetical protein
MSQVQFKKLPGSLLKISDSKQLVDAVTKQIEEQVEHPPFTVNLHFLALAPEAAQRIYWLWRFQCEAGISGMDVFILDSLGVYSPQIHSALKTVGATELAHFLEAAIPLAREGPAEFKRLPDQSWFNQFRRRGEFAELHLMNKAVFTLVDALTDLMAAYIRMNGSDLFEGDGDRTTK